MDLHHMLSVEAAWNCTRAGGNCFTALLVDNISAAGPARDFWMESWKYKDLKAWSTFKNPICAKAPVSIAISWLNFIYLLPL